MTVLKKKLKGLFSIKAFLPRTLLGRSLMILITPIVLIQVVTGYVFFDRHWTKMTSRLAFAVAGEIAVLANFIEADEQADALQNIAQNLDYHLDLIVDFKTGAELGPGRKIGFADVWQSMVAQSLSEELRAKLKRPFVMNIDFGEKWIQVSVQLSTGVLDVTLPGRRLFSSSSYIFLLWVLGTSLFLLLVAILFMRNQIRPIRKLAIAAERFGKGRDVVSFRPSGAREVRQASQAFLKMHTRIRRQISQRTAMLAGVSHDLRTPLTRLKLQLEMMGGSSDVDAMKSDVLDMERMIEGYLDFVRGEGDESVSYTHIDDILNKVVASLERQGIGIEYNSKIETGIMLRPIAMERCINNLVGNAAKYAQNIWLEAFIEDENLYISVDDDGPGVPEEKFEEVFRPFYRVDGSRNTETGGVGLGLPIAMDIVHSHGGQIWLENSERGGLRVNIALPL